MRWLTLSVLLALGGARAETWVVSAGVEQYDDQAVPGLRFAVADAKAIDEAFGAAGVPDDHRRLLTSDAAERLAVATRSNILAALEWAATRTHDGDTLVFLFAGHGMETGGEAYLLPVDARRNLLADTALPMRLVNDSLQAFRGANVLFLVDACRNEPDAARSDADAVLDESFARSLRPVLRVNPARPTTVALLLACDFGQRAWEMPETRHGAFTNFVLRGLQGGAAEPDGTVRLSRLSQYVRDEVQAWAERNHRQQTPRLDNPTGQDFELPSAAAALVRPNLRNQPPALTVEGLAGDAERLLGVDEATATIVGTITDDANGVSLTAGGQAVRLVPAGPNRWTFSLRVTLEPGQAGEVPLEVTDAGGLRAALSCRLRRPAPSAPAQPPTPPTGPNTRPANWSAYLSEFQPPQGMTWGSFRVSPQDGMPQVLIPAGEFLMGSSDEQIVAAVAMGANAEGIQDERPQKRIYVSAFWMDLHEVTVGQYKRFCALNGKPVPSGTGGATHPVVNVSWEDATAYAQWAGRELPTEAQWEKAARGGTTTIYPWGDAWDEARANNSQQGTRPVGSYAPNGFGLFDMSGNVWEWCRDTYDEGWYAKMPARDPVNTSNGTYRVLRGGSSHFYPESLRVANRVRNLPVDRVVGIGFRCSEAP